MRIEARRIEGPAGRPPLVLLAFVAEQESHDGPGVTTRRRAGALTASTCAASNPV
jgi:hypothetical protein